MSLPISPALLPAKKTLPRFTLITLVVSIILCSHLVTSENKTTHARPGSSPAAVYSVVRLPNFSHYFLRDGKIYIDNTERAELSVVQCSAGRIRIVNGRCFITERHGRTRIDLLEGEAILSRRDETEPQSLPRGIWQSDY